MGTGEPGELLNASDIVDRQVAGGQATHGRWSAADAT